MRLHRNDSYKQMKRARSILSILLVLPMLLLAGCKTGEAPSNTAAKPAPADNSNQAASSAGRNTNSSKEGDASTAAKPAGPAQLIGTYESREVHDQGVVTLITQLKTLWMFSSDGTYSRVSEVKGRPYHADSGTFRIEPPDKLVLTIQVTGLKTKRQIQSPPLSKTHTFSLSPDGEELRLTSAKGSIGIFQRVTKPKTP
jgi:hypothetical protein